MLSEEEKKAIEGLDYFELDDVVEYAMYRHCVETIKNLIETQQKEIEELKEERGKYPIAMNDEQYKKVIELAQKDIKEELDRQINVRMINEDYIEKNYINKDKIREKIETQQKEIEELKQEKEYLNCIIESDKHNYINKDKIREKIEDLEKQDKESKLSHNYLIIPVLHSLLEEE